MSWTVSRKKPSDKYLLNRYFEAVGKALCVANNFEEKCNHILRVHKITDAIREGESDDEVREIATSFEAKRLYRAIQALDKSDDVSEEKVDLLNSARESRNYIAHEGALMGEVSLLDAEYIFERVQELAPHVEKIAKGDNLVSAWSYEVSEREPAPRRFRATYVERVVDWTFGDLIELAQQHFSKF